MKRDLNSMRNRPDPRQIEHMMNEVNPNDLEQAKQAYNYYAGKSERELEQDLRRMTREQLQQGTLTPEGMDRMAQQIAPMLDQKQRERLYSMIGQLKQ